VRRLANVPGRPAGIRGLQPLVTAPLDMCLTMARAEIEAGTTYVPTMVRLVCRHGSGDWGASASWDASDVLASVRNE
jgi:hypothetical protein